MSQTVVLKVKMSCSGCSGAVERALGKLEGVESCDIDLKEQKVTVKGNVQPETVFHTVSKTGKSTSFWEEPAVASPAPAPETAPASEAPPPPTTTEPAPIAVAEAETQPTESVSVA